MPLSMDFHNHTELAMSLSLILPMSAFALAASISPGPVNLVCLSSGTRYPMARGLIFVTGATLGFIVLFLAIGFGLHALLSQLPGFNQILRWGGIAFLLYLSYQLARDSGELPETEGHGPGFITGWMMQWLNPKAWLASVSGIAAYTQGAETGQVLLFAALYLPICWLSLGSWVVSGAFLRHYVRQPRVLQGLNRTLAALLAASCVFLMVS